jgi:drug/metabolite transporter (DMT)-like permease
MIKASDKSADLMLVAVTLLAACGWVFSREALTALSPMLFLAIRFLLSSVVVGSVDVKALKSLSRSEWRRAWITGTVLGIQTLLWILGLYYAEHLGVGAFLISLGFILVPVIGWCLFRLQTSRHTWLAIVISTSGLALLMLSKGFKLQLSDGLFLLSALVFALYINLNGRYAASIKPLPLTSIQLAAAGVITLVASLCFERASVAGLPSVLGWLLASVLLATSLRFFLMVKAQATAAESHTALIMTLEPVWVALLGVVWLGESMSAIEISGCILIFLGLISNASGSLLQRRRRLLTTPGS